MYVSNEMLSYTLQFKELNSKLNREVAEFERSAKEGTHTLSGCSPGDIYMPPSEVDADTPSVLGNTVNLLARLWTGQWRKDGGKS